MRVAFDIGGTFTDIILFDNDGRLTTAKVPSVQGRIGLEIASFVKSLGLTEGVDAFVHATTVCSNALIERTLPVVAFVTTKGFGDILDLMGQRGPIVSNLSWERSQPLLPRHMCFEIDERVLADGTIAKDLNDADVQSLAETLRSGNVRAVAVSLINSFVNGTHEERIKKLIQKELPDALVCISSEIDPEMKEYERASTTVINTSLIPIVNQYLDRLRSDLDPLSSNLRIMQSNGGTMSSTIARQRPMTMVESGPAAGVLAAASVARELDREHVLSFDMGGTTAKACFIERGRPLEKPEMQIAGSVGAAEFHGNGHSLRAPSIDIVEVGAGGGSVAWIDRSGALRVGPMSAGADPGPVCYQKGGTEPTVTDANVVLGYINPIAIAAGTLQIDRDAAVAAITSKMAVPLGLTATEAAYGVIEVANATMMRALRSVSTERGRDIRASTLVAFGGSGPLHAASLCESVGISTIVIPPVSGVFSALGLLVAGERLDYVHSIESPLASVDRALLRTTFESVVASAVQDLALAGLSIDEVQIESSIDLRYRFDPSELNLALDLPEAVDVVDVEERFKCARALEYGLRGEGEIHVSRLRVRVTSAADLTSFSTLLLSGEQSERSSSERRRDAYFGRDRGAVPTRVVARTDIVRLEEGPLIVEEATTTVVVPPGWTVRRDRLHDLVIERVD
jgi:N-methylhydantoinase A